MAFFFFLFALVVLTDVCWPTAGLNSRSHASRARYVVGVPVGVLFVTLLVVVTLVVVVLVGVVAGDRDGWAVGGLLGHKWLLAPVLPRLLDSFFHNLRFADIILPIVMCFGVMFTIVWCQNLCQNTLAG